MPVQTIASKQQFDDLIASGKTIFVDFYADWCGPCKAISPLFHKLAGDHADKEGVVEFYQIDIDGVQDVAAAEGIRSIPAFRVYRHAQRIGELVGANQGGLTSLIQTHA